MESLSIIQKIAIIAMPAVFAIVLHEVAHGWVAYKLGDPTAHMLGRLTLNPIPHIDLVGTIVLPLLLFYLKSPIIIGYAKPVPIDPRYFKDPKKGMAISSLAGPGINLIMAVLFAFLLQLIFPFVRESDTLSASGRILLPVALMLSGGVLINVLLAVFNLLPIPPLDGSRIVYWLLPPRLGASYYRLERFGMLIIFGLFFLGVLGKIIGPIMFVILNLLFSPELMRFMNYYLFN